MSSTEGYEVIVLGGGIAGSSLAITLARQGRKVMMIERDMTEPDTFRGELLQPGGVNKLKELGLEQCIEGIDGKLCYGYVIYKPESEKQKEEHVKLTFPDTILEDGSSTESTGMSFHHGRFVQNLRKVAKETPNLTVLEANALALIEENDEVLGVTYRIKGEEEIKTANATLTIDCTGAFSKLRKKLSANEPTYKSHFVALLLKNCKLPYVNYGYVTLAHPAPVLCYQIAHDEVRMLIAIPDPLPSVSSGALKSFILNSILPQLPEFFKEPVTAAVEEQLRSVPCRILPTDAIQIPGAFALGDSLNMRHPLTGGGMTVAFTDVTVVAQLLAPLKTINDRQQVAKVLESFYSMRKNTSSTINILAQALYDVFCGASANPALGPMREGCFAYFPHYGSDCLAILSGLNPSPHSLVFHFFAVAGFTVWKLLTPYPTIPKIFQGFSTFKAAFFVISPLISQNYLARGFKKFIAK